ncbi:UNVERIFIED_CONTAM: hypothetical protein FKN15_013303 [Acipenser sinensis]
MMPYDVIKSAHDVIKSAHDVIKSAHDVIKSAHDVIKSAHDVIKSAHDVIKSAHDVIKSAHDVIKSAHDVIKSAHDVIKSAHDVIKSAHDVIKSAHIATGHGIRDRVIKLLSAKYENITREAIQVFIAFCLECQEKRKRPMTKGVVVKPILSYLLLREMEEVTLYQPKREGEEAGNGRSFLLVDENENLQKCYEGGREVIVIPKTSASSENPWLGLAMYAWSGYVLECPCCGIIYRSRQYWIGNQDPESCVVRPEVKHVWPGSETFLTDHQNAAQRMLDGMNFVIQSVSDYSSGPTKAVTAWITDQVAPPYWRPNADITGFGCHSSKSEWQPQSLQLTRLRVRASSQSELVEPVVQRRAPVGKQEEFCLLCIFSLLDNVELC